MSMKKTKKKKKKMMMMIEFWFGKGTYYEYLETKMLRKIICT
jgi:hypothetical protein